MYIFIIIMLSLSLFISKYKGVFSLLSATSTCEGLLADLLMFSFISHRRDKEACQEKRALNVIQSNEIFFRGTIVLRLSKIRCNLSGTKNKPPQHMSPHHHWFSNAKRGLILSNAALGILGRKAGHKFLSSLKSLCFSRKKKRERDSHVFSAARLKGCNVQLITANHNGKQCLSGLHCFIWAMFSSAHKKFTCRLTSTSVGGSMVLQPPSASPQTITIITIMPFTVG